MSAPSSVTTFSFDVGTFGATSAEVFRGASPRGSLLLLAHGAGAPRTHPFMRSIATRLAGKGVDVITFNFLYAEAGRKMPDRIDLLEATWRAAIMHVCAREALPPARLFIGGKSMGGRIATRIAGAGDGLGFAGVVLLGYPLHPAKRPSIVRDEILGVTAPLLVVQGTRDELGTAAELTRFVGRLPCARMHVVEGGDHSFALSRREGPERQERELDALAAAVASFVVRPTRRPRKGTSQRR